MGDGLLTDEAISEAWPDWPTEVINMENPFTTEQMTVLAEQIAIAARAVAKAQDLKSVKEERQAVAGWSDVVCDNEEHYAGTYMGIVLIPPRPRSECPKCTKQFFEALRKGHAPTESGEWDDGRD